MLAQFEQVSAGLAECIVAMAEERQKAEIERDGVPIRAEAAALKATAVAVTALPWGVLAAVVILVATGNGGAALITAAAGLLATGPQLVSALRSRGRRGRRGSGE
jgi:hypothetical protein